MLSISTVAVLVCVTFAPPEPVNGAPEPSGAAHGEGGNHKCHYVLPPLLESASEEVKTSYMDMMKTTHDMKKKDIESTIDTWAAQQTPEIKASYDECKKKMVAFFSSMTGKLSESSVSDAAKEHLKKMGDIKANKDLTWAEDSAQTGALMSAMTPELHKEIDQFEHRNYAKEVAGQCGGNSIPWGSPPPKHHHH